MRAPGHVSSHPALVSQLRVHFLDRDDAELVHVLHALDRRFGAEDRREGRHARQQRRGADLARIGDRVAALLDRVDDQRDLVVLDHVDDVRPALGHLVDRPHRRCRRR